LKPDDSEFDFRTAMNIWGKLRKRHILVEKAKESTEKSKLLKKMVMKSLLLSSGHTTESPFTFNTLDKRAVELCNQKWNVDINLFIFSILFLHILT
jgi:hypothetical protein